MRGRIDLFSTDALINMLARLGVGVPSGQAGQGKEGCVECAKTATLIRLV